MEYHTERPIASFEEPLRKAADYYCQMLWQESDNKNLAGAAVFSDLKGELNITISGSKLLRLAYRTSQDGDYDGTEALCRVQYEDGFLVEVTYRTSPQDEHSPTVIIRGKTADWHPARRLGKVDESKFWQDTRFVYAEQMREFGFSVV